MFGACEANVVHILHQTRPPCKFDQESICNLTTPGAVGPGSLRYTPQHSGSPASVNTQSVQDKHSSLYNWPTGATAATCGEANSGKQHKHFRHATKWEQLQTMSSGPFNGNISVVPTWHIDHKHVLIKHDSNTWLLRDLHVGVGCGSQPLPCQTNDVQTWRQLVEEPWVTYKHKHCLHVVVYIVNNRGGKSFLNYIKVAVAWRLNLTYL